MLWQARIDVFSLIYDNSCLAPEPINSDLERYALTGAAERSQPIIRYLDPTPGFPPAARLPER